VNIAFVFKLFCAKLFEPTRQIIEQRQIAFGIVAIIGFPLYYYIWHSLFPQPYENLPLRLAGSAIFLPIALMRYWPAPLKKYLSWYWYAAILFGLPFFFTFMMLKNGCSAVWINSTLVAVFVMILLLNWAQMIVHFVIGTGVAWIVYGVMTQPPQTETISLAYLPIVLFAIIIGAISNHSAETVYVEQERAMLATAASVAHELRTPLLGIRMGTAGLRNYLPALIETYWMARQAQLPVPDLRIRHLDTMKGVLDRIEAEANYSNAIIDMLITNVRLFRPDEGQLTPCSMSECVAAALERYPFSGKEREKVEWQSEIDFVFMGSSLLMTHVLFNLLKNALRHIVKARKGMIVIHLEMSSRTNRLIFRDTGSGIAPEVLPHIFKRFYSSPSVNDSVLGAGIGLAFSREVVHAFGGTIACLSEVGEFTEFILTFPRLPT
jgi:signal transduction histidine kinase